MTWVEWMMESVGWTGAGCVVAAYLLLSTRHITSEGRGYQALNLAGGALLVANTAYHGAYPSTAVNVVWVGIAIYGIWHRHRT